MTNEDLWRRSSLFGHQNHSIILSQLFHLKKMLKGAQGNKGAKSKAKSEKKEEIEEATVLLFLLAFRFTFRFFVLLSKFLFHK